MNLIERKSDVISGHQDLEFLYKFNNFPIFMGCVSQSNKDDVFVDMEWKISKTSGMVQLGFLLPLDILYPDAHGAGQVGGLWREHHCEFAEFILRQPVQDVLEIGGSHGILSKEFKAKKNVNWTIVDPNPVPNKGVDATFIKGFFDEKFSFDGRVDTVVHSHVFEHVYHLNEFVSHISDFLEKGQMMIFSVPNMSEMIKRKYTNCINFEHTTLLTEPYIENLLSKHGFKLIDKRYFKDDHSVFFAYVKNSKVGEIKLPSNLYKENKRMYLEYVKFHKSLILDLNEKIDQIYDNQTIYLFGAHVFTQYLISFGLNISRVSFLLDNDREKQGKRLYGTNLTVASPEILSEEVSPVVILRSGVHDREIEASINKINSNTKFLK